MTPTVKLFLGGGAGLLFSLVLGWFRPLPDEATHARRQEDRWTLPPTSQVERASASMLTSMGAIRWVGGTSGAGTSGKSSPWTLLGIVQGPDRAILIQSGADPLIKRMRAGDTLPDGLRLVDIHPDTITLESDGCRRERTLYQASGAQKEDGCGNPEDNKETPRP